MNANNDARPSDDRHSLTGHGGVLREDEHAMTDHTSDELCRRAADLADAGMAERAIVTALIAAAPQHQDLLDASERPGSQQVARLLAKAAAMWTTRARRDARRQVPGN